MKLTRLSEPSDIILEHILSGTDIIEQLAIIGRVAHHLGCRIEGNAADHYRDVERRREAKMRAGRRG